MGEKVAVAVRLSWQCGHAQSSDCKSAADYLEDGLFALRENAWNVMDLGAQMVLP